MNEENKTTMYDLLIIGGGPAGSAAGVYAARKRINSVLITQDFGGQSKVSPEIQNFVGIPVLEGSEMASMFKNHLEKYADDVLDIVEGDKVTELKEKEGGPPSGWFEAVTDNGDTYKTKTVIAASGGHRKKLPVPGADELEGKGVVYCASCDAPLFGGMKTVVVGGGNAGFEAAEQLIDYAEEVTLLERSDNFKADPSTVERVSKSDKVTIIKEAQVQEITGDKFVDGVVYQDKDGNNQKLDVQGVFIEIGSVPNNKYLKDLVDMNEQGEVIIDHKTARTSKEGIWAGGDLTDDPFKQNNISMGHGVTALEDIYQWLNKNK